MFSHSFDDLMEIYVKIQSEIHIRDFKDRSCNGDYIVKEINFWVCGATLIEYMYSLAQFWIWAGNMGFESWTFLQFNLGYCLRL
jgi:hypothetical protein